MRKPTMKKKLSPYVVAGTLMAASEQLISGFLFPLPTWASAVLLLGGLALVFYGAVATIRSKPSPR